MLCVRPLRFHFKHCIKNTLTFKWSSVVVFSSLLIKCKVSCLHHSSLLGNSQNDHQKYPLCIFFPEYHDWNHSFFSILLMKSYYSLWFHYLTFLQGQSAYHLSLSLETLSTKQMLTSLKNNIKIQLFLGLLLWTQSSS